MLREWKHINIRCGSLQKSHDTPLVLLQKDTWCKKQTRIEHWPEKMHSKKNKNPHFCFSKDIPFPRKIDTSLHECSESICCITSFAENVYFVFLDLRLEMETNSQFLVEINCYFIWMWFKHLLPRKIRTLLNWFHGGLCLPAQVRQRKLAVMQDNNNKKRTTPPRKWTALSSVMSKLPPRDFLWCGRLMKWWLTKEIHLHLGTINELLRPRHGTFTEVLSIS